MWVPSWVTTMLACTVTGIVLVTIIPTPLTHHLQVDCSRSSRLRSHTVSGDDSAVLRRMGERQGESAVGYAPASRLTAGSQARKLTGPQQPHSLPETPWPVTRRRWRQLQP